MKAIRPFILISLLEIILSLVSFAQVPIPTHVVIVIEENHDYTQIIGSSAAPYINSLATGSNAALFTQSYALTHPSQSNYIMLYSGSNQGVTNDNLPSGLPFTTANLGASLLNAGKTFLGYSEGLPSVGYNGTTSGAYARKHNPWANWQSAPTNGIPTTANLPLTFFPANYDSLPTVSFVIPNQNNDMHNGSNPTTITTGDTWLQNHLNAFVQWAKTHNSLLILTFDEGTTTGTNRIVTIFVGQMVASGQYSEVINHYSILRTLEDMYELPYAGNSTSATPITDCWTGTNPTITATAASHGSINPSGVVSVNPGANQTFNVTPNAGYHLDSLIVDGTKVDSTTSYTFTSVNANHTIRAVFAINQYTINASAGPEGTISPNGTVVVNYGSNQTFTISPTTGHHVDSLVVDGVERDSITSYTFFNVTSNHTIESYFGINQYSIVATAGVHGMISPVGTVSVTFGDNQTFTITPDSGYEIWSLHVDGLLVTPTPVYQFMNISSNHTISAEFGLPSVTQTISVREGWNIISVPLTVADARASSLFPAASSAAYGFDPTQGYVVRDTLQNGVGYWLKFPSAQNDSIRGGVRNQDSLTVYAGWNLVGSISSSAIADSIIQIPPGIVLSSYYRYHGTYSSADTLEPGGAYWVKISQNGRLVLK